jgi:hypothetical protein
MNQIVPCSFLFRWSFVARRIEKIPSAAKPMLGLPDTCRIPNVGELDQKASVADVRIAWNDRGLALSVTVSGRTKKPECVATELTHSDGIRLWIDTRNMQTVHRATKFCHYFIILPAGGGPKRTSPVVRSLPVARAREEVVLPNAELVQVQSEVSANGYSLEVWFPAEVFVGFEPSTNPRLGIHYIIHDTELGDQNLAVGNEFPYDTDPSLWQTLELVE